MINYQYQLFLFDQLLFSSRHHKNRENSAAATLDSMDSIEDLTAVNALGDIIINAINTIRKNKNRPDETSIYEFLNKNLENANVTKIAINERLTSMSNNNRITNKLTNGKNS